MRVNSISPRRASTQLAASFGLGLTEQRPESAKKEAAESVSANCVGLVLRLLKVAELKSNSVGG